MAAIDYATTLGLLNTAVATTTGADRDLLVEIRDRLSKLGTKLTQRFTSEVDDAKTAWEAVAEAAFDEAVEAADFVFTEEGETPPAAITWNTYSIGEIVARIAAAQAVTSNAFLRRALKAHQSAVSSAFAVGPSDVYRYTVRPTGFDFTTGAGPGDLSVAEIEREIYAVILEADQALDLAAA